MHLRPATAADRGVPPGIARAFLAAVLEVDAPDGTWTVTPHAQDTGADTTAASAPFPPDCACVAVVTAHNPDGRARDAAANAAAQRRLAAQLRDAGHATWPARGRSPDGVWVEPSLAVPDADLAPLVALARDFGQAALFRWRPGHLEVVWTPAAGTVTVDDRAATATVDDDG